MLRAFLILVSTFFFTFLSAQQRVTFRINSLPSYHQKGGLIYIAGSFNNWDPGNKNYQLANSESSHYTTTILLPKGRHEYKLTRGTWLTNESDVDGVSIPNRSLIVNNDTTINIDIKHWADHFNPNDRKSTARKNVSIIDTAFYIPQLNRYRRIWVYLPPNYTTSHKKYPVLYMHDGQNLFDDLTSFSGEWGIDETLDTLSLNTKECIVVGIDNGGDKRLNEYSPYNMERFGKGEGDQYVDFLVKTLKPYIDKKYRTKKCRKHRFIAGSSMGGLISFYAILKYPKVFGGAGVFSPAFWIVPGLKTGMEERGKKIKGKIYFYAGMQESETMVPDMLAVFAQMNTISKAKMTTVIRSEGKHNEQTWRKEFPLFYKWIMK
ncbi:MAG TPA: alpha/beta hydrolase-fold protein [Chitinophagaceae bacterium]|nr:alpha/beta hydrolase-fold protein [Chitinophagaceae bacterium]